MGRDFQTQKYNDNWDVFKEIYQENIETYIPSKIVKPGQRLLFLWVKYKSVKKAKRNHREAQVKARKSGLLADQETKKETDAAVLAAKAHYENKLTHQIKEDPKRFFNYTRHFTKFTSTFDVLEHKGLKVTDDETKAELLNSFFCICHHR